MLDKPRDESGLGLLKDKTGFGPCAKEWEGPEIAEERLEGLGKMKFELLSVVLSVEEVERREVERERASR